MTRFLSGGRGSVEKKKKRAKAKEKGRANVETMVGRGGRIERRENIEAAARLRERLSYFASSYSPHPSQRFVQRLAHHLFIPVAYFRPRKASSDVCTVMPLTGSTGFRDCYTILE